MAVTAQKDQAPAVVGLVAEHATELAEMGLKEWNLDQSLVNVLFKTVARGCKTPEEKKLYLMRCKADGLNPLRQELFAIRRKHKAKDGRTYETVTYCTSYHVFTGRCQAKGVTIIAHEVCANDQWGGWDAVACAPAKHITAPEGARGAFIGAWACARENKTGRVLTGKFWPASELGWDSKTGKPIGDPNPLRMKIPGHFLWKTAACRIARLVVPSLASLYGIEELMHFTQPDGTVVDVFAPETAPGNEPRDVTAEGRDERAPKSEDAPEAITFKTKAALMRALAIAGHTSASDILEVVGKIAGGPINALEDLSEKEALEVLANVEKGGADAEA